MSMLICNIFRKKRPSFPYKYLFSSTLGHRKTIQNRYWTMYQNMKYILEAKRPFFPRKVNVIYDHINICVNFSKSRPFGPYKVHVQFHSRTQKKLSRIVIGLKIWNIFLKTRPFFQEMDKNNYSIFPMYHFMFFLMARA